MSLQILLAWFAVHFFCWLIQAAFGDLTMAQGVCEGFMCNTPMRAFVDRNAQTGLDEGPTIADIFLVTIVVGHNHRAQRLVHLQLRISRRQRVRRSPRHDRFYTPLRRDGREYSHDAGLAQPALPGQKVGVLMGRQSDRDAAALAAQRERDRQLAIADVSALCEYVLEMADAGHLERRRAGRCARRPRRGVCGWPSSSTSTTRTSSPTRNAVSTRRSRRRRARRGLSSRDAALPWAAIPRSGQGRCSPP